jgi:predicted nucleic acid-binding protein
MAEPAYLIDTNILLRWVKPDDRDHTLVRKTIHHLLRRGAILSYTSQNVAEFWNVCTRPLGQNGFGLSPQDADSRACLFEGKLRLLPDSLAVHQEWRRLIVQHGVRGVHVHDARLVAAMHVHTVQRILTFNDTDFTRFSTIEALHPRSLAARIP